MSTRRILVVAAHPDDEILGCGAAIAKHVREGDRVRILVLGEGITSRRGNDVASQKNLIRALKNDAKKSNAVLGVEKLVMCSFPDNAFDSVALLEIIHAIEETMEEFKPHAVYTHHYADVNIDHRRTAEAVEAASRPMAGTPIEEVLSFEIPSSSEWNFIRPYGFRPNVFIAVSEEDLEKKCKALETCRGEIRPFPHPRSREYLLALARVRGGQIGVRAAEGFSLVYKRKG